MIFADLDRFDELEPAATNTGVALAPPVLPDTDHMVAVGGDLEPIGQ